MGTAPHLAAPDERTARTAAEAERLFHLLHRICGKWGTVNIYGTAGRPIGSMRLASLAREERGIKRPTPDIASLMKRVDDRAR